MSYSFHQGHPLLLFCCLRVFFTLPQRQTYPLIPAKITPLWKTIDDPLIKISVRSRPWTMILCHFHSAPSLTVLSLVFWGTVSPKPKTQRCHKTIYETEKSGCMVIEQVFCSQHLWVRLGLREGGGTHSWHRLEKWRAFSPETAGGNWVSIGCCLQDHRAVCKRPTWPHVDGAIQPPETPTSTVSEERGLHSWSRGRMSREILGPQVRYNGRKTEFLMQVSRWERNQQLTVMPSGRSQLTHLQGPEATKPSHKAGPLLSSQPLLYPPLWTREVRNAFEHTCRLGGREERRCYSPIGWM